MKKILLSKANSFYSWPDLLLNFKIWLEMNETFPLYLISIFHSILQMKNLAYLTNCLISNGEWCLQYDNGNKIVYQERESADWYCYRGLIESVELNFFLTFFQLY